MNIDNHIEGEITGRSAFRESLETTPTKYQERERLKQEIKKNQGWYFIDFIGNIPRHRPYGFTLFNKPFVLWKDSSKKWSCYSLPISNDNLELTLFTVKEKEGEVWFWKG